MNFDSSRLRRSDQIIGGSAIAFLIFLFIFKWYGVSAGSSVGGVSFSSSANGWNAFHNSRWLWLLTIIAALLLVAVDAGMLKIESPVHPGAIVAGLGALSTVFIIYRIVHHPTAGGSTTFGSATVSYSAGIKIGIWLGLIAAVGITYGGYLRMRDDSTSLSDVRQQASSAVSGLSASGGGSTSPGGGSTSPGGGSAETPAPPIPPPAAPPIPPPAAPPGPEPPGTTPA